MSVLVPQIAHNLLMFDSVVGSFDFTISFIIMYGVKVIWAIKLYVCFRAF
ncbi:hypothetical protein K449DRAFT_441194 [Hypoxylon sp. EC38]|nr:hypothetical protein K449DRAFT_441194 [Hypoxylon sp. EC38]